MKQDKYYGMKIVNVFVKHGMMIDLVVNVKKI